MSLLPLTETEADEGELVPVCAQITNGTLERNVSLKVQASEINGNINTLAGGLNIFLIIAVVSDDITDEMITFLVGDETGVIRCVNVSITQDDILETNETYQLSLIRLAADEDIVEIGRGTENITIIDNDSGFGIATVCKLCFI